MTTNKIVIKVGHTDPDGPYAVVACGPLDAARPEQTVRLGQRGRDDLLRDLMLVVQAVPPPRHVWIDAATETELDRVLRSDVSALLRPCEGTA